MTCILQVGGRDLRPGRFLSPGCAAQLLGVSPDREVLKKQLPTSRALALQKKNFSITCSIVSKVPSCEMARETVVHGRSPWIKEVEENPAKSVLQQAKKMLKRFRTMADNVVAYKTSCWWLFASRKTTKTAMEHRCFRQGNKLSSKTNRQPKKRQLTLIDWFNHV